MFGSENSLEGRRSSKLKIAKGSFPSEACGFVAPTRSTEKQRRDKKNTYQDIKNILAFFLQLSFSLRRQYILQFRLVYFLKEFHLKANVLSTTISEITHESLHRVSRSESSTGCVNVLDMYVFADYGRCSGLGVCGERK